MKKIFIFLLFINLIYAVEFAKSLPVEIKQLVESFSSFSPKEKMAIYSYSLALKYRYDHLEDKEALKKSDLDYWRLWSIVSEVEEKHSLSMDFDDILEEIMFYTPKMRKRLKRLRWAESAIHTDGSGEWSERMRKYDEQLMNKIMTNPPKWTFEPKNKYLYDYNLTTLKKLPEKTIPKKDYQYVVKVTKEGSKERNFMLREKYLNEEYIRNYDNSTRRKKIATELSYLNNCFTYFGLQNLYHKPYNHIRSLAKKVVGGYGQPKDLLPKQIKNYCENNITKTIVGTFAIKPDKPIKQPKTNETKLDFAKTEALLREMAQKNIDTKPFNKYFNLAKTMFEKGSSNDLVGGLRLLRLTDCIRKADKTYAGKLMKSIMEDVKKGDNKQEYTNSVLRPQLWWMMTIGMIIKQSGETQKLKHFFDCNATDMQVPKMGKKQRRNSDDVSKRIRYDRIIRQKDEILKYYAATFVNTPTPDLDNKKAIEAGIIPDKWVEKNGTIKNIASPLTIEGMPEGGIKLTYKDIPGGEICERITTLNRDESIFFDHKTYEGLDYILIDGHKVKTKYFDHKYALRLCNSQDKHTISFVKEKVVAEDEYKAKKTDCCCDRYAKKKQIAINEYNPDGFAVSHNKKSFVLSGNKSAIYDTEMATKMYSLPKMMDNSFSIAISPDGSLVFSRHVLWNSVDDKIVSRFAYNDKRSKDFNFEKISFLNDGKTLVGISTKKDKVKIADPIEKKILFEFAPKFFSKEKKREFGGPQITCIAQSADGKYLYIGGNRGKLEIWGFDTTFFGNRLPTLAYKKTIAIQNYAKIGAIAPDPTNSSRLYIAMGNNKMYYWDIERSKPVKTYIADEYMTPRDIQLSDDNKFILVYGFGKVFVWRVGEPIQWDIFDGSGIKGATFVPNSHDIITAGKYVDLWNIKNDAR